MDDRWLVGGDEIRESGEDIEASARDMRCRGRAVVGGADQAGGDGGSWHVGAH